MVRSSHRRPAAAALVLALAGTALAGCQTSQEVTGSTYPSGYRERHPIVLADKPRVLDLFVEGQGGLNTRQRQDLAAFSAEYRRLGSGGVVVQVPVGVFNAPGTRHVLGMVRSAFGGRLAVERYEPQDPAVASPLRVTFRRLQASVGSTCGLWPEDLGVNSFEFSQANEQYWNFGCATQANFAAQVADPVDLVRGRQMTPPDTQRRMYNFDQIRKGQDPSTTYKQESQSVKSSISQ